VVSERGADPALERELESGVVFAEYDELVDRCVELLSDESARHELAGRGYQLFSARSQAEILKRALSGLESGTLPMAAHDDPVIEVSRDGQDDSADHQLRERQLFRHKFVPDRDKWLAKVERDPEDARSIFFRAETSFQLGDFAAARQWYARRMEMGGCSEEVYWAMYRFAASMAELDEPWADVQDAYLKAWEFRPTRAEALHAIAFRYRNEQRYQLGYLYARRASEIPFPEDDLFVVGYSAEIYAWRAADEQAICAFWIGRHAEAFTLCRRLLTRPDIPGSERRRIATNRDFSVPAMLEATQRYPAAVVGRLAKSTQQAEVTVSLIAGPDRQTTEQTINSFLNSCLDASRIGRFMVLDTGLSAPDRGSLQQRYRLLEFADCGPGHKPVAQLARLRAQIHGRFWLHLGQGWRFFAPENFITRLTAVLNAEPQVFQVGINFADAAKLTGASTAEQAIRRAPNAGRYLLTQAIAAGPAMFDTARPSAHHSATPTRPPNADHQPPPPRCAPPASTKCSASQICASSQATTVRNYLGR
jgi:hypothetical protein